MGHRFSGIEQKDVTDKSAVRDTRSAFDRFREDDASSLTGIMLIGGAIVGLAALFPFVSYLLVIIAPIYYYLTSHKPNYVRPPIYLPISAGVLDNNNLTPGTNPKPKMASGIVFLGNDRERNGAEVWVDADIFLRHLGGYGTTGSGKTETLLATYLSILCQSASLIEIDGKAAADTGRKFQNLVRRFGREDCLCYANYMTAGVEGNKYYRISNKTNPLSSSNAQGAYQFLSQFISGSDGPNKIFAERAATVSELTTNILYDRQEHDINYTVSFGDYDKAMQMTSLLDVIKEEWLSEKTRRSVVAYLQGLNIDTPEQTDISNLKQTALDQHLYATMQFTRALNSITGTYGYIFNTRYGDFNWDDIIRRHRIIKVMLPSMEKASQEREYLVNLNVTMLKLAASKFLDYKLVGHKSYTRYLPHDKSLSVIIFDESNYLLTDGIGILAGQLRSMKFGIGLCGQSLAAMRTRNQKEVEELEGNTGLKLYGALEDMVAIKDAIERAGQRTVIVSEGYSGNRSRGYKKSSDARMVKKDVLDVKDIKGQREGEWTLLYKDKVIRLNSFYIEELNNEPSYTRVNTFCHAFDERELPSWIMKKITGNATVPDAVIAQSSERSSKDGVLTYGQHRKKVGNVPSDIEVAEEFINSEIIRRIEEQRESIGKEVIESIRGTAKDQVFGKYDADYEDEGIDIDINEADFGESKKELSPESVLEEQLNNSLNLTNADDE